MSIKARLALLVSALLTVFAVTLLLLRVLADRQARELARNPASKRNRVWTAGST
jgi:hypothetical protein